MKQGDGTAVGLFHPLVFAFRKLLLPDFTFIPLRLSILPQYKNPENHDSGFRIFYFVR